MAQARVEALLLRGGGEGRGGTVLLLDILGTDRPPGYCGPPGLLGGPWADCPWVLRGPRILGGPRMEGLPQGTAGVLQGTGLGSRPQTVDTVK